MNYSRQITTLLLLTTFFTANSQEKIPLYKEGNIPNSIKTVNKEEHKYVEGLDTVYLNVSIPDLTVYVPEKPVPNAASVIICPGGGYQVICFDFEGKRIAKAFNELGITVFVLKYRIPDDERMVDKKTGPLQDVQQAFKIVREQAGKWKINPNKIGVMGFSAGGHLASSAGTHFDSSYIKNKELTNLRPDFMMLVYPVISMADPITHSGSRDQLIGKSFSKADTDLFSNELRVTNNTPPALLVLPTDDGLVSPDNSIQFYQVLRSHHVSAELHVYHKGNHGMMQYPAFNEWFGRCIYWLKGIDML